MTASALEKKPQARRGPAQDASVVRASAARRVALAKHPEHDGHQGIERRTGAAERESRLPEQSASAPTGFDTTTSPRKSIRNCAGGADQGPNRSRFRRLTDRMRSDLRLAVVTLYSVSSFAIIGAFGIYRFSIGDWLIGLADGIIVCAFCSIAALAWNPRWTRRAANLFAIAASVGGMITVLGLGASIMWVFGLLVGNFLMADRRIAIAASAIVIASVALQPGAFPGTTDQLTFVAVATMISLFSLIFSARVDSQHRELRRIASHDGLTGALNRRSLDRDLTALCTPSVTRARQQSLVIMDVDDFKALNDAYGHEAGDTILSRLTELVETHTRRGDRFYRYGGEEFVLLLENTGLAQARIAVDKLRGLLAARLNGPGGPVTVSMGLAERQDQESAGEWLYRADLALLEAKRAGKDRYEVA